MSMRVQLNIRVELYMNVELVMSLKLAENLGKAIIIIMLCYYAMND